MGMTPLEGLVMATRAGSIDPGLVLWVQQYGGLSLGPVQHTLEEESGLKGLAGTGDMREVLATRGPKATPTPTLAFAVYIHQLRREIGAMTASAGGRIDAHRVHRRRRRARARGPRRRDRRRRGRRGPGHRSPRRHRDRAWLARVRPDGQVSAGRRSARACVMTSPGITRSRHGVSLIATKDSAVGLVHTGMIDGS